jgi:curved DNA-binding protein CbpA
MAGLNGKEEEGPGYFHMYRLIDQMKELTKANSFYELLEVTPSADEAAVGQSFRRLSRQWHPDKSKSSQAHAMYSLLNSAATILRNAKSRAAYEWLLHEAPPWHRSSYMVHRLVTRRGGSPSLLATILLMLVGSLVVEWLVRVGKWTVRGGEMLWQRRSLEGLGEKEVKRMRKKAARMDPRNLLVASPEFRALRRADSPVPPFPRPWNVWLVRLVARRSL